MGESKDLIIIGASAAGVSAAVYAARRRLDFRVLTGDIGGEIATSGEIENWLGVSHTNGIELAEKLKEQLEYNKVDIEENIKVTELKKEGSGFVVIGQKNGTAVAESAKSVIVATGVHPRELNVPGEKEFKNKGLSYCTVCDGPLFPDKAVAVVGGGNSALESAIMMSEIASKVYIINKNEVFKGDAVLINKVTGALSQKNVEVIYGALTQKILGEGFVTGLEYKDASGEVRSLKIDGIFVHIGMVPNSGFLPADAKKNNFGEIEIDRIGNTNIPGLFAAGDVTDTPYKQIAVAAGQGVSAALSVVDYLNKLG